MRPRVVLSEFTITAADEMVHTQSQNHKEELEDMFAESPGSSPSRKRKIEQVSESQSLAPKRLQISLRSQTPDRISPSHIRAHQQMLDDDLGETVEALTDDHMEAQKARERQQSLEMAASAAIRLSESPTKTDSLPSTDVTIQGDTSPTAGQFEVEQRASMIGSSGQDVLRDTLENKEESSSPGQVQPIERKVQKRREKSQKAATGDLSKERKDHSRDTNLKYSVTKSDALKPQIFKPSTHRRFDSEEPGATNPAEAEPALQSNPQPLPKLVEEYSSDSDAAPEAITKSVSTHLAQSAANEISKTIAEKAAAEKVKRRKRNETRKLQAQTSAKRTMKRKRSSSSPETLAPPQKRLMPGDPLPDLLPDYILQSKPGEWLPPLPEKATAQKPNKLRFLEREEKAPKDVRKGDVTVRVLKSKGKLNMPPRANKSSRDLRESWLRGIRKGVQMERKSWKRSFVRR